MIWTLWRRWILHAYDFIGTVKIFFEFASTNKKRVGSLGEHSYIGVIFRKYSLFLKQEYILLVQIVGIFWTPIFPKNAVPSGLTKKVYKK